MCKILIIKKLFYCKILKDIKKMSISRFQGVCSHTMPMSNMHRYACAFSIRHAWKVWNTSQFMSGVSIYSGKILIFPHTRSCAGGGPISPPPPLGKIFLIFTHLLSLFMYFYYKPYISEYIIQNQISTYYIHHTTYTCL